jgi:transposase
MESTISTGNAAKLLGVSVKTLQRWEREGRLIPVARTDSNRRLYTETQHAAASFWGYTDEWPDAETATSVMRAGKILAAGLTQLAIEKAKRCS